jgi:hypothetical protein
LRRTYYVEQYVNGNEEEKEEEEKRRKQKTTTTRLEARLIQTFSTKKGATE